MSIQNSTHPFTIRSVISVEECLYFQELERRVWDSLDVDMMPSHVLVTCIKNGGSLLAAFAQDGPPELGGMVGAVFGWPGVVQPHPNPPQRGEGTDPSLGYPLGGEARRGQESQHRLKFCSHIAGVLPEWQGRSVGVQLKLAQRKWLLSQGYTDWITWTYDPLFRVNGVLNIHRLGATCNTYYRNVYGLMMDGLNAGAPTDRCQVDWQLNSERVRQAVGEDAIQNPKSKIQNLQILPTTFIGEFQSPLDVAADWDGRPVAAPIPNDISAIRRKDSALAMTWRLYLRNVLEGGFAAGYQMVDCVKLPDAGWYYILEK